MQSLKSQLANIATNARRFYNQRAGVPCWNPSKAAFYVLRLVGGLPRFLIPTLRSWAILERAGKRNKSNQYNGLSLYTPRMMPGVDCTARPRYMVGAH